MHHTRNSCMLCTCAPALQRLDCLLHTRWYEGTVTNKASSFITPSTCHVQTALPRSIELYDSGSAICLVTEQNIDRSTALVSEVRLVRSWCSAGHRRGVKHSTILCTLYQWRLSVPCGNVRRRTLEATATRLVNLPGRSLRSWLSVCSASHSTTYQF